MMSPVWPPTPANISAASPVTPGALDIDDIQGDILVGLQKQVEIFQPFTILDVSIFKKLLRTQIAKRLTSTRLVIAREFQVRDAKGTQETAADPIMLPLNGLNVGFTNSGIEKLKPTADLGDASFHKGAIASAAALGDPVDATGRPSMWVSPYIDKPIDGVFILTAGSKENLDTALSALETALGQAVQMLQPELGAVRHGEYRGHEHFGFQDGISQPAVKGLGIEFPGQRALSPGWFVFGYTADQANPQPPQPPLPWMQNGSFMVFRRLKQFVPEFDATLSDEALRLGMDAELLGARMMGRWKSGAQTTSTPLEDNPSLGEDPFKNNDFDFSGDQFQRACPYGAHIRKLNPRSDLGDQDQNVDPRRIMRQGIPFGEDVTEPERAQSKTLQDRGLLFVCYQTSIVGQFEFLQASWANNPSFNGQSRPPVQGQPAAVALVGQDPIIGQNSGPNRQRETDEAVPNFPLGTQRSLFIQPADSIVAQGGAYLFVPSVTAIINDLSS